jgi:hypothetical protein
MEEIWKYIKLTNDIEISNFGNVRSSKNKKLRYKNKWKGTNTHYWNTQYTKDKKVYTLKVHRLVAEAFIPNPENKPQVNHIDGNGLNNHVSNLEWVTAGENKKHAYKIGYQDSKGSKNSRSKLDEELVFQICMFFHKTRFTPKQATIKFNISMQQATKIRSKKSWLHVSKYFEFIPLVTRVLNDHLERE